MQNQAQPTRRTVLRRLSALVMAMGLVLAMISPASASAPILLSGSAWLGGNGVNVCTNTGGGGSDPYCGSEYHVGGYPGDSSHPAAWWQCVELAQRLYLARGWHSGIFAGVNYAYQIYWQAGALGMTKQANGSITSIVPGDMIVHNWDEPYSGEAGHVSIVNGVNGSMVSVVEQNTYNNDPAGQYTLSAGTLSRAGSGTILGVVHDLDNHNTAPAPSTLRSGVSATKNADGRIELLGVAAGGSLLGKSQSQPNGTFDVGWYNLPATAKDVTTILNTDGRMEVMYIGGDGAVWGRAQTSPNGGFGSEYTLGGWLAPALTATRNADGRIQVFAIGTDSNIYTKRQLNPGGGFEAAWTKIAAGAKDVAAATNADGRIELMYIGKDGAAWGRAQTTPNSTSFGAEYTLGGYLSPAISAVTDANGKMEVFVVGTNGSIYRKIQLTPSGGFNSTWEKIPAQARDVTAVTNADGRIELLYVGADSGMWGRAQIAVNDSFGAEYTMAGWFR